MPQPKKKKKCVKNFSIHDELLFITDEEKFSEQGIDLKDYENIFSVNSDHGDDRLYLATTKPFRRLYFHISPHLLAWHHNLPSEIAYDKLLKPFNVGSAISHWWMNTNTELVTIYKSNTEDDDEIVSLFNYRNQREIDKILLLNLIKKFLEKCKAVMVGTALFPTLLNPKRIYVNVKTKEMGFFELGHFQFFPWPVNEHCRITDHVYSHPSRLKYLPDNAFKKIESIRLESKITGLLNFYIGSVLLLHFCLTGLSIPEKNSKYKDSKRTCTNPNGVCKALTLYDPLYHDFFHRFYCVIGLTTLPTMLKATLVTDDGIDEFIKIYEEFLQCLQNLHRA